MRNTTRYCRNDGHRRHLAGPQLGHPQRGQRKEFREFLKLHESKGLMEQQRPDIVEFHPCVSTYVVLDGILVVVFGGFLTLSALGMPNAWIIAVLSLALLVVVHAWIASHRLVLSHSILEYRSLWRTEAIAFSQIEDFEFRVGWDRYCDRSKPFYRIVIRPRSRVGNGSIVINAKLFGSRDVRTILDALAVACPAPATLDKR